MKTVPRVIWIADDVYSKRDNETSHDVAVLNLLKAPQSKNLKFHPDKIQFGTKECKFFGQLLIPEGRSIDQKKVNAIRKMDAQQYRKEMESFQGMANYLKWYSSRLIQVAEPLKELLRGDILWCWEFKHQKTFNAIKEELTKTPVVAYFDPKADHIIQVDGSMKGLGVVLLQKNRHVIYVSRTLTLAETGYSNIERGLLSIIF